MDFLAEYDRTLGELLRRKAEGQDVAAELACAHAEKAQFLHGFGRLDAAIPEYDAAITLLPDGAARGRARLDKGTALRELGRASDALAEYDRGIPLLMDEDLAVARLSRARLLAELDRQEEALAEADRAISLRPEDELDLAEAHRARAGFLCALGRFKEAVREYDTAIGLLAPLLEFEQKTNEHLRALGSRPHTPIAHFLDALEQARSRAFRNKIDR